MAADYPSGLTSKALMGQAQDNISSTINQTGGITAAATTVTLASGTAFPTSGYIQIDTETLKYTGKSSNDLTGLTRGLFGTAAAAHSTGVNVELTNSAGYIDELQEEVVALQTKVGVDTSAVTTTLDYLAKSATARVYLNANQSIPNNTLTKILFDTEDWDTGSNFASNKFTAPVAGKYQVNATISWGANGTERRGVHIYKNGTVHTATIVQANPAASGGCVVNVSDILSLAATDYVEVYGLQTSGVSLDANSGASESSMSIALIKL